MNPSNGCVFGCCTPSLSVNSFPTLLILDAICKSFSSLISMVQVVLVQYQLSFQFTITTPLWKNKLSSIDVPFLLSPQCWAVYFLRFCPRCPVVAPLPILHRIIPCIHMHVCNNEHYSASYCASESVLNSTHPYMPVTLEHSWVREMFNLNWLNV